MMDIVVFDNEKAGCEQTKQILEKYAGEKRLTFQIKTVHERDELIEYIKDNTEVCAAFLDMSIGESPGGMLTAKEINRIAPDVTIIFLTGYIEYVPETNGAKHICFVLKEALERRMDAVFARVNYNLRKRRNKYVCIHSRGKEMVVREDDILYMERKGRVTYIQCRDECIDTPDKLSELEKYLSTVAFVRCHNSYIVNLTAVKEFARTEFLMIDKARIPVSRYKLQETREKFMAWFALGYGG